MPFYTPTDLTSNAYVASMGPQAKDSALAWSKQALDLQQSKLAEKQAQVDAAAAALAQAPTRQQVNAAKAAAADPTLTAEQRAAAAAQATALDNQRTDALITKGEADLAVANQAKVVEETQTGISNLQQAGAVPNPAIQSSTSSTGAPIAKAVPEQVLEPTNSNSTGLPVVAEDGTVNKNIKINPETGELYTPAAATAADEIPKQQINPETGELYTPLTSANLTPQEQKIIENTRGIDVVAEDGTVNKNIKINPETGELYTTEFDAQEAANANESAAETARLNQNSVPGLSASKLNTQSQATQQDSANFKAKEDWRVRLSLAPGADYLYAANPAGILAPLSATNGIIFPYTPAISVSYAATYDPTELTHTNYKFFTYKGSNVDSITISCDFTAQDVFEANYLLAVIHFFRSITKMFYGQDPGPVPGTPPPLCYLSGLGAFQFDAHPLAITAFTYNLPTDVDYIRAGTNATFPGVNRAAAVPKSTNQGKPGETRMANNGVQAGAIAAPPNFSGAYAGSREPTYVPTKINLSISAVPIVTRNDISNNFSLKQYATGALLRGTTRQGSGGGIW